MIIGLTGPIAAGKTTIAEILKKKGFEYYTYSDILRIEARKRGTDPTRENLQKLGTEVKEKSRNPGILSKLILENAKSKNVVADGIRTPDEIEELKKARSSTIIGITASQEIRYRRMKERNRPGDPATFEDFKKIDDDENRGKRKGQNIGECLKNADFLIENNGSQADLKRRLDEILKKISA